MTTTHSRFALGVCVLSAGLLIGSAGGAIANADPEAGGSTAGSESADGSTQSVSPAAGPVESTAATGTSEPSTDSAKVEPARPPGLMILNVTTIIERHVAAVTKQLKEASASTAAVGTGGTSDPGVGESQPTVVATPTPVAASDSNVVAPVVNPLAAVQAVVPLVTSAVAPAAQAITSLPRVVVSLPTSPTPVTDVITAVQDALTSVAATGIAIAQVPSDLASMLGFPKGMAPGVIGGTLSASGLSAAGDEPVLPSLVGQSPQILGPSGYWAAPSAGDADGLPLFGTYVTTSMSQDISATGAATAASEVIAPTGVLSSFEHTVSAVLVPASLVALAALALPGIGGLLIISAAGMLVGYRQAKAASSLRASGIARFARVGPLGVVRSGSLIALHSRIPTGISRRTSRANPLERVA